MRILSNLLFVLTALLAGLALLLYFFMHGMACSYSTDGGGCRIPGPWALGAEDFKFLVLIPWGTVVLVGAIAIVVRPGKPASRGRMNQGK